MTSERVLDMRCTAYVFDTTGHSPVSSTTIFRRRPARYRTAVQQARSEQYRSEFGSLVEQAQGNAGLMRFLQLDLDGALAHSTRRPRGSTEHRLVRLIAGNPVTIGADDPPCARRQGSYAPVTILIEETPGGGTRVAYDSVASAIAPYDNAAASEVAGRLDAEVLGLLREATGVRAPATP